MTTMLQTSRTLLELARDYDERSRSSRHMREAAEAIAATGFPTPRDEQWRYFPTGAILEQSWTPAAAAASPSGHASLPSFESAHITIVNGRVADRTELPRGVTLEVIDPTGDLPEECGSTYVVEAHPFAALNLLLTPEVIVLRIDHDVVVDRPIHLDFHSIPGASPAVVTPRVLIVAARGSRSVFVESWHGEGALLVLPVVEIVADAAAALDHVRLVLEGSDTSHIANVRARTGRDANVRSFLVSMGGGRVRNEIAVSLDGPGAETSLDGLWMLVGEQRADQHTTIDHASPHTTSRELYKGVLGGRANGIFEGLVVVRPDAQKISSDQTNNNLLLSTSAVADSKPQLEIHADDVRCSHGSTIGQLDENALFYLQSRGISLDAARRMLTLAFAGEMIDRLPVAELREPLRVALAARVPQQEVPA